MQYLFSFFVILIPMFLIGTMSIILKITNINSIWLIISKLSNLFWKFLIMITFVYVFLIGIFLKDIKPDLVIKFFFYYFIIFSSVIVFNYIITDGYIKIKIINFLDSILEFLMSNFFFNIFLLVTSTFIGSLSRELLMSLVGAYIFYVFTGINEKYKLKNEKNIIRIDFNNGMNIVIKNIFLIILLSIFESVYFGKKIKYLSFNNVIFAVLFISLIICIYFYIKQKLEKNKIKSVDINLHLTCHCQVL